MKEKNSGITLVSLVITIIVLIILASITVYSGISTIRSSRLTKFTTELKMMQQKVNELYDSYTNNKSVTVNGIEYVGKGQAATETTQSIPGIQEIGENPDGIFNTSRLEEIFSEEGSGITDKTGYMYYDTETITALGLENMEYEFFVNVAKRSVVSIEGFNDYGKRYYTLDQVPDGVYNVEYNHTVGVPTFDVSHEQIGDNQWKITISNIQYDGYISKWDVKYQIDGQTYWNTSEDLSFVVNEKGLYKIYIENGEIKSAEKSKALGVPEPTPEVAEGLTELSEMHYGVIEVEFLEGTSYNTTTMANAPILGDDMRAVYWGNENGEIDETIANNTTEIDSTSTVYKEQNWYNYEGQETDTTNGGTSRWANAIVTVGDVDSYFVWIPRYAYRISYFKNETSENQYRAGTLTEEDALKQNLIVGYSDARGIVNAEGLRPSDVASQTAISVNEKYFKTHPAFEDNVDYGGWSSKLEGIWVAKYEVSSVEGNSNNTVDNVTTKHIKVQPGIQSWRFLTIGNMYTNAQNYSSNLNSHLMKNSEWGAVLYLTESKYGRNGTEMTINSNSNYYTGGGSGIAYINNTKQSSTGNIYGIYDLLGGASEYVAGYYSESSSLTNGSSFASNGGTSTKYATAYTETTTKSGYRYGDATYETNGWNGNSDNFVYSNIPFFSRGNDYEYASNTGMFWFDRNIGVPYIGASFHICLTVQ